MFSFWSFYSPNCLSRIHKTSNKLKRELKIRNLACVVSCLRKAIKFYSQQLSSGCTSFSLACIGLSTRVGPKCISWKVQNKISFAANSVPRGSLSTWLDFLKKFWNSCCWLEPLSKMGNPLTFATGNSASHSNLNCSVWREKTTKPPLSDLSARHLRIQFFRHKYKSSS
jgi:hypothetical protein